MNSATADLPNGSLVKPLPSPIPDDIIEWVVKLARRYDEEWDRRMSEMFTAEMERLLSQDEDEDE